MDNPNNDKSLRHAFLIMAHNNWHTLSSLMRLLDATWVDIYLHIDKKATDFPQSRFLSICKNAKVYLIRRHSVTWGNESQVKVEMELFKAAYRNGPYRYYHLLSGTDLPLKNINDIYQFFADKTCNFLTADTECNVSEWRLQRYYDIFRQTWLPEPIRKKLNVVAEIIQYKFKVNRIKRLKRKYPIFGKGHNWCDLTQHAVGAIVNAEKDIKRFCRFTHCSDEMYKQIILLNQPSEAVGAIATEDIRLIDWSAGGSHPRVYLDCDYDHLMNQSSCHIFARKFDERIDCTVIDRITNHLLNS